MVRPRSSTPAIAGCLVFTLVIALISGACGTSRSAETRGNANRQQEEQAPVIAVTTAKSESREIPAYIQATGSMVAQETSSVAPKVAGKVVNVEIGRASCRERV